MQYFAKISGILKPIYTSNVCYDKEHLDKALVKVNNALIKGGSNEKLYYALTSPTTRRRQRNIWFNLSLSENVKTKVAQHFLDL